MTEPADPSSDPASTAAPRARIVVARPPVDEYGHRYAIVVSVDGEKVGRLRPGGELAVAVDPGRHEIRVSNTLVRKRTSCDLAPGEVAEFVTENRANFLTELAAGIGFGLLSVSIERRSAP